MVYELYLNLKQWNSTQKGARQVTIAHYLAKAEKQERNVRLMVQQTFYCISLNLRGKVGKTHQKYITDNISAGEKQKSNKSKVIKICWWRV